MRTTMFLFSFLVLILLAGCATSGHYDTMLKNWHGKSIEDFLAQNGPPIKKDTTASGNTVYVYFRRNPDLALLKCTTWVEVDAASQTIVNTRWEGGNCAAYAQ